MTKKKEVKEKRTVGRPPLYKTPEEMQERIDAYFEERRDKPLLDDEGRAITNKMGDVVYEQNPPTVSGLALYLGFCDRFSLYQYGEKAEFTYTVKKAINRIADYAEQHLYIGKATGPIYWLKNHGWVDKTSVEVTGTGLNLSVDMTALKDLKNKLES